MSNQPAIAPGRGTVWRPLTRNEVLPSLHSDAWSPAGLITAESEYGQVLGGGAIRGTDRCSALGLWHGDCHQKRTAGSRYCYYHDKVQRGLLEPEVRESYPVWPLPVTGYALISKEEAA